MEFTNNRPRRNLRDRSKLLLLEFRVYKSSPPRSLQEFEARLELALLNFLEHTLSHGDRYR